MKKKFQIKGISGFFFLFYCGFGFYVPFVSVYLKEDLSFNGREIGFILGAYPFIAIFAQILSGFLSDFFKKIRLFLYLSCSLMLLTLVFLFFLNGFWSFFVVFCFFSISLAAIFSLSNLGVLEILKDQKGQYGKIRFWGSLGFLISSFFLSSLFNIFDKRMLFVFFAVCIIISFLTIASFPERENQAYRFSFSHLKAIKNSEFWFLVFFTLLFQISFPALDVYLGILMRDLNASASQIGLAWAIGVLFELPVMYFSSRLLKKLNVYNFLLLGVLSGIVRWTVYYFSDSLYLIYLVQPLHGLSFTCLYNGGIYYVEHRFSSELSGSVQNIYDGLSRLLGYFLGMLLLGWVFDFYGIRNVFFVASLFAVASFIGLIFLSIYSSKKRSLRN